MSIDDMGQAETDGLDVRVPPSNRNGVVAPIVIGAGAGRVPEGVRFGTVLALFSVHFFDLF